MADQPKHVSSEIFSWDRRKANLEKLVGSQLLI